MKTTLSGHIFYFTDAGIIVIIALVYRVFSFVLGNSPQVLGYQVFAIGFVFFDIMYIFQFAIVNLLSQEIQDNLWNLTKKIRQININDNISLILDNQIMDKVSVKTLILELNRVNLQMIFFKIGYSI